MATKVTYSRRGKRVTAAVNRGGSSMSATGTTKRQAYSRLRSGLGQSGG